METVVVLGGNHHNTLGVIRGLGRKGILSEVILHSKDVDNYVLRSKYVISSLIANSEREIADALIKLKGSSMRKVVICCSDYTASVIDGIRDSVSPYFWLPGCKEQGALTKAMNKDLMSKIANQCGMHVPRSVVINKQDKELGDVPYPCITKPISSLGGGKSDIRICQNEKDLKDYLTQCSTDTIQLQQYINKSKEIQLIGIAYDGEVLIPGRSRIITQPLNTNTGYLRYEKLDGTEPIIACENYLRVIGYSGLFSAEFICDEQGTYYFMEVNYRNDGNAICVTESGVNLPYLWYQYCRYNIEPRVEEIKEIFVLPEFTEISLWYRSQISFKRLLKEFWNADVYMEYAKDDPLPTKGRLTIGKRFVLAIIKKPIKKMIKWVKSKK